MEKQSVNVRVNVVNKKCTLFTTKHYNKVYFDTNVSCINITCVMLTIESKANIRIFLLSWLNCLISFSLLGERLVEDSSSSPI